MSTADGSARIGEVYRQQRERFENERRQHWLRVVQRGHGRLVQGSDDDDVYVEIADAHRKLGEYNEAVATLRDRVRRRPSRRVYEALVPLLERSNRTEEARAEASRGARLFPDSLVLRFAEELLLPIVYDSDADIDRYRERFSRGLDQLSSHLRLDDLGQRREALRALARHRNVRLPYQDRNDRELQRQYGVLAHRIMAANYPALTASLERRRIDGRLRVGYVSSRFRNLSASKYFLGWIRGHDPSRFEVYSYHLGDKVDPVTDDVRRASAHFRHIPRNFDRVSRGIVDDRLDIVVFVDVGLDPLMTLLSAVRLAPIQCAAWDQPVTTGSPVVDFFLSSDLAEPESAQEDYTERIIRLPGVGVCYPKPVIPTPLLEKTRSDFGVRADTVVYLCNQSVEKYLPAQDELFAQIAARVPHAQFVFLTKNPPVQEDLRQRLERTFRRVAGLSAGDRLVMLSEMDIFTFWNLNLVGDAVLDPIGWSGGVSTFEAIACRLPVVTLPGRSMRGRQSAAILAQLGVTDTVARDRNDYVEIAVRLALNREWRDQVVRRMVSRYPRLYGDRSSITALEDFYQQATRELGGTS